MKKIQKLFSILVAVCMISVLTVATVSVSEIFVAHAEVNADNSGAGKPSAGAPTTGGTTTGGTTTGGTTTGGSTTGGSTTGGSTTGGSTTGGSTTGGSTTGGSTTGGSTTGGSTTGGSTTGGSTTGGSTTGGKETCVEHVWVNIEVVDENYHHMVCKNCNEEQTEKHDFDSYIKVYPTCVSSGVKEYRCTVCDYVKEEQLSSRSDAHKYGDFQVIKAATCTEDGVEARTCAYCLSQITRVIKANGQHAYGDWTVEKEATCTEAGLKVSECANCHDKQTEEIPALGHAYGDWTVEKEATCTEAGLKVSECANCHDKQTEEIPALGHAYGDWTVVKEATATEAGLKERVCSVCSDKQTEEIPALGHDHAFGNEWKSDAENHWHECACGEKADSAAHNFVWKTDKEATTSEKGLKHEECTVCGYAKEGVEIDVKAPEIIEGANSTWNKNSESESGLSFRSSAPISTFVEVKVNGEVVARENYDVREGSIIVEFKPAYLATLTEGEYTVTICSTAGDASTKFTVESRAIDPQPEPKPEPQPAETGCNTAWIWIVVAVVVVGGIGGFAVIWFVVKKKSFADLINAIKGKK